MNIKIPKIKIPVNVSRAFHRTGFKIKQASPEILLGAGIIGGVVTVVTACKATIKAQEIIEEAKDTVEKIHEVADNEEFADQYTEEDMKKDLTIAYVRTGVELVKVYLPSIITGAASVACVLTGHNIIRGRNAALAAYAAAVKKNFDGYRGRLTERFGEELDNELLYGIKAKEIEEVVTHEDGTTEVVKTIVNAMDPNAISDYAFFFDDTCLGYTGDPETDFVILKNIQAQLNNKLQTKTVVLLNDLRDAFGLPRTKAGQHVGWKLNGDGDGYIDLGIFDKGNERARAFVNGYENVLLIDPNVDGPVYY